MNKKILLLEPNTTAGRLLLSTAKSLGLYVVAVTQENVYQGYDRKLQNELDEVWKIDFSNFDTAQKEIVKLSKKKGVDGVVSGFEFFSDLAVKIASELQLPTNDLDFAEAYRDKYLMAKVFESSKVPCAKTMVIENKKFLSSVKFPVIVKPSKNAGSCYVQKVENLEELQNAYEFIEKNDNEFPHGFPLRSKVIVQEILEGPEFSVEVVVSQGKVSVLCVTDKQTTYGRYFAEVGHIVPSCVDPQNNSSLQTVAVAAIQALHVTNGVAHVEIILTTDGPKVVEVGVRLPGDYIPNIIFNATGINEAELYLKIALGMDIEISRTKELFSGIKFIKNQRPGKIKKIVSDKKSASEIKMYVKEGDEVEVSGDNISRLGHIINTSSCYRTVDQNLFYELRKMVIEYE
ncbi:ATP-grasp domain-containing protein [Ligilactobacillus faecis]|uniref:ATP-grasp domain-containing protein n=1 Tax=Ligilactobacillus faecis TaxID=762833 RepID=UPI002468EA2B|nr:ATP-grasp domain-containing protein [Ligilactobacillus faecis]WGN89477.1 ATP-grasp domain-containing protein [Ligilactobacillus faecis]